MLGSSPQTIAEEFTNVSGYYQMLREHRLFIGEYHGNIVASLLLNSWIHADILGDACNCIGLNIVQLPCLHISFSRNVAGTTHVTEVHI